MESQQDFFGRYSQETLSELLFLLEYLITVLQTCTIKIVTVVEGASYVSASLEDADQRSVCFAMVCDQSSDKFIRTTPAPEFEPRVTLFGNDFSHPGLDRWDVRIDSAYDAFPLHDC